MCCCQVLLLPPVHLELPEAMSEWMTNNNIQVCGVVVYSVGVCVLYEELSLCISKRAKQYAVSAILKSSI